MVAGAVHSRHRRRCGPGVRLTGCGGRPPRRLSSPTLSTELLGERASWQLATELLDAVAHVASAPGRPIATLNSGNTTTANLLHLLNVLHESMWPVAENVLVDRVHVVTRRFRLWIP